MTDVLINNALSAKLRLLHKRQLKWESLRLRDALVAWSEGKLIPAVCKNPEVSGETIPCAYTEVYGQDNKVIALTANGVYQSTFELLDLPSKIRTNWVETVQAREDAKYLTEVLSAHPFSTIFSSTQYHAPEPLVKKDGFNVIRYAQGPDLSDRFDSSNISSFPDQQTCFEWIGLTARAQIITRAANFFNTLEDIPEIAAWLQNENDWVTLTKYLPTMHLDDIDKLDALPTHNPAFIKWMFERGGHRDGNFHTFLKLGLEGLAPDGKLPDRLAGLVASWREDDEGMFRRARSAIPNWFNLVPCLCEHIPTGASVRNALWSFFSEFTEMAGNAAKIAVILSKQNPESEPDDTWLDMIGKHINAKKITYTDLPTTWAQKALKVYVEGDAIYSPYAVLNFLENYFLTEQPQKGLSTFCSIIENFPLDYQPFDLENTVVNYAKKIWPDYNKIWDVVHALELGFTQWSNIIKPYTISQDLSILPDTGLSNFDL